MLILTRKEVGPGVDSKKTQLVFVNSTTGDRVVLTALKRKNGRIRLGVEAPATVQVFRAELETSNDLPAP